MTELLYMQGFDVESCTAVIETVTPTEDDRYDITLDRTCFYARGGGQDWDMGTITHNSSVFTVDEVRLDEHATVHHIGSFTNGTLKAGDNVECTVDHVRRAINSRLHSAGHVIDMAVDSLNLGWIAGKGSHYPHMSSVEYTGEWDPEKAESLRAQIEKISNTFIRTGGENQIEFMTPEEMHKICKHVPDNLPTNKPGRIVIYKGDFGIPCGGTHVKNLEQVGQITITKLKSKKGVIKVSYAVAGIN